MTRRWAGVGGAAAILIAAALGGRWVGAQDEAASAQASQEIREVVRRGSPSVVRVRLVRGTPLASSVRWALFRRVNDRRAGAGVVVSTRLVLVHEVQALYAQAEYEITTEGGRTARAKLQARVPAQRLAILRSDQDLDATPVTLGSSTRLAPGNLVVAVGDPFGLGRDGRLSASLGVLEGRARLDAREVRGGGEVLLTSAAINPGSEGGALFDLEGRLVGLLAPLAGDRRLERPRGGARSGGLVGYAIPVEACRRALAVATRPDLGFKGRGVGGGVLVVSVAPKGPSQRAGLRAQDTIVSVNGRPIRDAAELRLALERPGLEKPSAKVWRLEVLRAGKRRTLEVKP